MVAIICVTGKLMEYIVDTYVMGESSNVAASDLAKGAETNYKIGLLKGEEFSTAIGKVNIYKSENSMVNELDNL